MRFIGCSIKHLKTGKMVAAAKEARRVNPLNAPLTSASTEVMAPQAIAVLTTKYWGAKGVRLKVGFMERISSQLAERILSHFNAWSVEAGANVEFTLSTNNPEIRISFSRGGYWSYLGTDVLQIPQAQQTMNLEGFNMSTSEAEFRRVIRHEVGHTLGFPHEHMRADLVARLDANKTIAYFGRTQGWSAAQVRAQVLTPLSEASLMATPVDQTSIMCYQLPATITVDGKPIPGGLDINPSDAAFAAKIYPKVADPTKPNPTKGRIIIEYDGTISSSRIVTG
jgi:hypothetical protein